MAAMEEEEPRPPSRFRAPHIKKRALKNKALSVSFSEKDLTYFIFPLLSGLSLCLLIFLLH